MFKRFSSAFLAGFLLTSALSLAFAADGPQFLNVTGTGSRHNTSEIVIVPASTTDGTAADLRPGTDNLNSLGTSTYRFKDLQTVTATIGGALTQTGNLTVGSSASVITSPPAVTLLNFSSVTLTPTASFMVISATGNWTSVATPFISTVGAVNGQWLTVLSTAGLTTVQDNGVLSGSLIETGPSGNGSVVISSGMARAFIMYNGIWHLK